MSTHKQTYTYDYPHPAVTTDIVVFSINDGNLAALLIRRGEEPYREAWALPGGFLKDTETVEVCAARELKEETGVANTPISQFGIYSKPGRDPRGWVVSVAYLACTHKDAIRPKAGSDAAAVGWHPVSDLPVLAFDHHEILADAVAALKSRVHTEPLLPRLLAERFTLSELQDAMEIVVGAPVDKRNFRRQVLESGWVEETDEFSVGRHRPARLYVRAVKDAAPAS